MGKGSNVVRLRQNVPERPEDMRAQAERTAERAVAELIQAFGQRGAAVYLQLLTNNLARFGA